MLIYNANWYTIKKAYCKIILKLELSKSSEEILQNVSLWEKILYNYAAYEIFIFEWLRVITIQYIHWR